MAITLTIAGAAKHYRVGSLKMTRSVNNRTTASFDVRSNDGTYLPALRAEVVISQDGTPIMGGTVSRQGVHGVLGDATGGYEAIVTGVTVASFEQLAERIVIVDGGFPAGFTLLQALTSLTGNLAILGVTLDGAQVTGPTLPELVYKLKPIDTILNELSTVTGKYGDQFVWEIDPDKVLRMYQPVNAPAPFDVETGDGNTVGDITVEQTIDKKYANRIYVKVASQKEDGRTEVFTGDGVADTFTLVYTPTAISGIVLVGSGGGETISLPGNGSQWSYDSVTNTITRDAGVSVNGETYSFSFNGVYNSTAMAEDASATTDPWEKVLVVEDIPSDTTLQALADAALAKALAIPKIVKFKTRRAGLLVGQSMHVEFSHRDLDDDAIITAIDTADYGDRAVRLLHSVTATTGTTIKESWEDVLKLWAGDKSGGNTGGVSVAGPAAPLSTGVAPPPYSIQFNRAGKFGGDANFTYYEDTNVLLAGVSNVISSADPSNIQIFGIDNEVAD